MFKNVSLRLKLVLAFLFVTALLVTVSVYQIFSLQQSTGRFNHLVDDDISLLNALQDVGLSKDRLLDKQADYQLAVTAHTDLSPARIALLGEVTEFEGKLQTYQTVAKTSPGNQDSKTINTMVSRGNLLLSHARLLAATTRVTTITEQRQLNEAQSQMNQSINASITKAWTTIQQQSSVIVKANNDITFMIGVLTVIATIVAAIVGIVIANFIGRSIVSLGRGAERIANGDFSQAIDTSSTDEIGQVSISFNRMAQRLRESYRRLALEQQRDEAILKGMGEGIIAIDEEGKIVVINGVAAELLDLGDTTSIIRKPIQDAYQLYHLGSSKEKDTKIPTTKRPSYIALKTGKPVVDVYGFHTEAGLVRQLNIAASPFEVDGKVVGVVTILRDVTKEKEIDRMKTEFISLASHQLRTPLSAIKWFVEMLVSGDVGKLKPDQLDFANNIAESTERMIALVNSLLNISRIESGRIMIVPQPTDLSELVGGIVNDLKAKTEERQQNLIISVHEGLPKVNIDPRLIGQVYLNLLTNAIKYTQKGGEISVFISKKDGQIISQVTDNGYGIPKEQQARLFEKFFRASNAVKVETDGTGLGLYLIKAIIESSGGKIWFESEEGKGSTFWFSIPMSGMKAKEGEVTLDV
jgi:signal transduction histidine kinase